MASELRRSATEPTMELPKIRILALEPDAERGRHLRRLVAEHVDADVAVARSWREAVGALDGRIPDLVLTSALVPREDDEQLLSHLESLDHGREVPILTVPPVIEPEPPQGFSRRWFSPKPHHSSCVPAYDRNALGERIAEAAVRARAARRERSTRGRGDRLAVFQGGDPTRAQSDQGSLLLVLPASEAGMRERARRLGPSDVPWLTGVRTPWGQRLDLLNISASGLLVEAPSRLMADSLSELHLMGTGRCIVVPTHLVRSEVSEVTRLGVKYRTAARFDHRLDLLMERQPAGGPRLALVRPADAPAPSAAPPVSNAW
jgi:hypothetical protein